jgi:gliding motility-associated-like protein
LNILNEGTYYFEAETIDNCGFKILYSGEIGIEIYEPPTISKPSNIKQCDNDNDGFYAFNLNTLKDAEVLTTQDPTVFEVVYFKNQTDAANNINAITMPYINSAPFSTDTLIARIQNIQNPICFETESFTVQVSETPNPPTTISNLSVCDSDLVGTDSDGIEIFDLTSKQTEILNGQNPSNFTITYLKTSNLSTITNPTTYKNSIANLESITVSIVNKNNSNCTVTTSFNIEVYSLPTITNTFTFKKCDEDGLADGFTDFNLDEANDYLTNDHSLTITYYLSLAEAKNNTNQINASRFSNKTQATVFARIENTNGCFRVATVNLLVSATSFPANFLKTVTHCDDDASLDGLNLFDLSENDADFINELPTGQNLIVTYYRTLEDAQLETNEIPKNQPYLSEVPFSQTLFVRVESNDNGACFGLGPHLQLDVNPRPNFELIDTDIYCRNLPPKTVSIQNANGTYDYSWVNENGIEISNQPYMSITKEGVYTVTATSIYGCESFSQTLTVEPSIIATISENDFTITDDSDNNTITISTSNLGIGDYEFSLGDGFSTYQDEPYFENVPSGIQTVSIRDKNGCGIVQIDISVIGFPRFFTPNNDGHNDTWKISGVNENFYSSSIIYIFDRFGKLITQINPKGEGWNGLYNGEPLPASDYWFTAKLIDVNGVNRIRKGHFSLVR